MTIGILGGTFNPVHDGHIKIAYEALYGLPLDKVIFIPAGNPPHKQDEEMIDKTHRYDMVKLAINDEKRFGISDLEQQRNGYCYSIDTVRQLKKLFPDDQLYFIVGEDSIFHVPDWKMGRELLKEINFAVAKRKTPKKDLNFLKKIEKMRKDFCCFIDILDNENLDISSSDIRERIKKGQSITDLVPSKVEDYIVKNNVYKVSG